MVSCIYQVMVERFVGVSFVAPIFSGMDSILAVSCVVRLIMKEVRTVFSSVLAMHAISRTKCEGMSLLEYMSSNDKAA